MATHVPDSSLPFRLVLNGLGGHMPFEWLLLPLASPMLPSCYFLAKHDPHASVSTVRLATCRWHFWPLGSSVVAL
ncbi:hypothetical protein CJ030_MR4G000610 [Morella rubra]|uniref:Uncharacterized protein n=1 Tax=Morella rubra TaxID=262757 RepID=A0A6A1VWX3_9ROSI|nr:hypothetical protein CJ030_MR4G000610 [Morella rubra]